MKKPKVKLEVTGYILGEPQRKTFEHDTENGISAQKQAKTWALQNKVEVLETAKAPYRNRDRCYYARNPRSGNMNRVPFKRAGIITQLIPAMFAESGARSEEDKRQIVEDILLSESGVHS